MKGLWLPFVLRWRWWFLSQRRHFLVIFFQKVFLKLTHFFIEFLLDERRWRKNLIQFKLLALRLNIFYLILEEFYLFFDFMNFFVSFGKHLSLAISKFLFESSLFYEFLSHELYSSFLFQEHIINIPNCLKGFFKSFEFAILFLFLNQ